MKPSADLSDLLKKYFDGNCSQEELHVFHTWIRLAGDDERLAEHLRQEWEKAAREPATSDSGAVQPVTPDWDRMFDRLTESAGEPRLKTGRSWRRAVAAAVILFCISIAGYLAYQSAPGEPALVKQSLTISPGDNKALLTLADGSNIALDSTSGRVLAMQGNARIEKVGEGRLIYVTSENGPAAGPPVINTISTPRGGQYQVRLPDGTEVWLNAASSLRFPASFGEDERRVALSGEAYFEVKRDETRPFIVSSGNQEVEVLGTRFNIHAYRDEPLIKTTLISGSVSVTQRKSAESRLLKPGQEATTGGASGTIDVAQALPGQAIAWKNGKFMFDGESIENIMRKIARWYDVEIQYKEDIGNVRFTGSVSRFSEVADLLRKLELTGSVHFNIEGRKIIVMR